MDYNELISDTKKQFKLESGRLVLSENRYFYFTSSLFQTNDYGKIRYYDRCITDSLWKIFILITRIETTEKSAVDLGRISKQTSLYLDWLRVDMTYIHYEMRSLMDYVCQLLGKYFDIDLGGSYKGLFKIKDKKRQEKLGISLLSIIKDTSFWFKNLRETRTLLVHNGKMMLPLDTEPEFSFSGVYLKDSVKFLPENIIKKITNGENVYFVPYLTIYICLILNLLNQLGDNLLSNSSVCAKSPIMLSIDGLRVFDNWLDRTLARLRI